MEENIRGLKLVLLGRMGAGMSASGNTILGREAFISKNSPTSVTNCVSVGFGVVCETPVTVYDTPGILNKKLSEKQLMQIYEEVLKMCDSGLCAFLLVIEAPRFTGDDRESVEKIEKILGKERLKKTWILFTRGDELKNMTIEDFINDSEHLKTIVQRYDQRYHVFNNKRRDTEQVTTLITKLKASLMKGRRGSMEFPPNLSLRRLVLVGLTGAGKSSSGNTILGRKAFRAEKRPSSVTKECSKETERVAGREIAVVDTPGMFDTDSVPDEILEQKISRCINMSVPGPHAIVLVMKLDKFTDQERRSVQKIRAIFGEAADKHTIVLFTHGDELTDSIEEWIAEAGEDLQEILEQCGGRYHVFNNNNMDDRDQVVDFLEKVDALVADNGGHFYTSESYEDVELEKQEKKLRDEFEKKLKEKEKELESRFTEEKQKIEERLNEFKRYYENKIREARQEAEKTHVNKNWLQKIITKLQNLKF